MSNERRAHWEIVDCHLHLHYFGKIYFSNFRENHDLLGSLTQQIWSQDVNSEALALHAAMKLHSGLAINRSAKVNG